MINNKKAFLFDLNGTMINDMDFHIGGAWHRILNELGALPWFVSPRTILK